MQDSHPSRGIPMAMATKVLKLMGIGIAQMGIGTFTTNVFPLVIIFSPKSVFNLVDL